jgi:hypothetical protein
MSRCVELCCGAAATVSSVGGPSTVELLSLDLLVVAVQH